MPLLKVILVPFILMFVLQLSATQESCAGPYYYQPLRYLTPASEAMGNVNIPLTDEIGNSLFNNPAGLARNTKFKSEFLNLNLDANAGLLGTLGANTLKITNLGSYQSVLSSNANTISSAGMGDTMAFSWGGFAIGALFNETVRGVSDGTTTYYQTSSLIVPAAGYGLSLARGVVRLGYSLQYVDKAYGVSSTPTANSSASFFSGLNQGWGLSHTASVNFVFPYTYTPTVTLVARNIFGTPYHAGGFIQRATNSVGVPASEAMSVDAAFNFVIRLSGATKSSWYIQYQDLTSAYGIPFLNKFNVGLDLGLSPSFDIRAGMMGLQGTLGIAFRSKSSEIDLSWFSDPNPLSVGPAYDTKYSLQYKIFFQDSNTRDRESELKK